MSIPKPGDAATEVLISAMELLQEAEQNDVLVLIRNSEGSLFYRSNIDSIALRVGMCQLQIMFEQEQLRKLQ